MWPHRIDDIAIGARVRAAKADLPLPLDQVLALLADADAHALQQVEARAGGPFGASLWLWDGSLLHPLAPVTGNAVLSLGIGSAHAEAMTLTDESLARARALLGHVDRSRARLIQISSAESCPACRAKQILFRDHLVASGHLSPAAPFHVAFSVTYEETAAIAGFNDLAYDQALRDPAGCGALSLRRGDAAGDLPDGTATLTVSLPDQTRHMVSGHEAGFARPAEVAALHAGSRALRDAGVFESWDLSRFGPAILSTPLREPGPLLLTESLWANLREIRLGHVDAAESPLRSNGEGLALALRPYDDPALPLALTWVPTGTGGLANRAQHRFRALREADPRLLYNGADLG